MRRLALALVAVVGCGGNGSAPTKVTPATAPPHAGGGGSGPADMGATPGTDGGGGGIGEGGPAGGGPGASGARDMAGGSGGGGGVTSGGDMGHVVAGDMGRTSAGGDMSGGGGGGAACTLTSPQSLLPQAPAPNNQLWSSVDSARSDGAHIYLTGRAGKFKDGNAFMEDATSANPGSTAKFFFTAGDGPIGYTIRLDGANVLVIAPVGGFQVFDKSGTATGPYQSLSGGCYHGFALGGRIYCSSYLSTSTYGLVSVDESTAAQTTLASTSSLVGGLTHDATYLYYTLGQQVLRLSLGGGTPEVIATLAGGTPGPLAVDDAALYVGDDVGRILRGGKTPGATLSPIAQAGYAIDYILADGNKLYAAADLYAPSTTSTPFDEVVALGKDGSNVTTLVARFGWVRDMSTDDTYLYMGGDSGLRACK